MVSEHSAVNTGLQIKKRSYQEMIDENFIQHKVTEEQQSHLKRQKLREDIERFNQSDKQAEKETWVSTE